MAASLSAGRSQVDRGEGSFRAPRPAVLKGALNLSESALNLPGHCQNAILGLTPIRRLPRIGAFDE
jgi:hypothetical protein